MTQFFRTYGNNNGVRIVRTDQGGELSNSQLFRQTIQNAGYSVEITGADNSSQNAIAERPHRTLANMVRAGLENAGLPYRYWSDALLYAVYIKNRLPHKHFKNKKTPYEILTGNQPDLSKLRIFGSRIVTRKPGKRSPKISKHSYSGIFLRYTKTMRNIVYLDIKTKKIKTTTYAKFDEAHFSYDDKPPGAKILIELGMTEQPHPIQDHEIPPSLNIIKRHPDAVVPTQGSKNAAGFDLYSVETVKIPPQHVATIDTGISAIFPTQTYGRIASRSGLALKHSIEIGGGVIDPDYTGNIKVILHNFGSTTFHIDPKDRIAQLIVEKYLSPPIKVTTKIPTSERGEKGFGSTGLTEPTKPQTPVQIPYESNEIHTMETTHINKLQSTLNSNEIEMIFSQPIFTTTVEIKKSGKHPTLGLLIKNSDNGPIITSCTQGSPSSKISQWRQLLRNSRIHSINDILITAESNIAQIIKDCEHKTITLQIIPSKPTNIHPDTGLPQLNFDQFIHIANIHQNIIQDSTSIFLHEEIDDFQNIVVNKLAKNTFTRSQLLKRTDWSDWEQSEFLQLDQYEQQNMFGDPGPLPTDSSDFSVLPMIWVYLIKTDGRKKARCVANGAPHLKGTITLAATYAACLDQAACRLFWAIAAIKNKKVFGADAQNAFAEAPPPKSPLYLKTDEAFRNWWHNKHNESLPRDTYVRVNQAIQGHPESPRLWQLHIDGILRKLGFTPTTHEPCIYVKYTSTETVYFLRQVDDFAIACDDHETATSAWNDLDNHLKAALKR